MHEGPVLAELNGLEVIDCQSCRFAHLREGGKPQVAYESGEFQDDAWFAKERDEHLQGLWDAAYRFQWEHLLGEPALMLDYGAGAGWFLWCVARMDYRAEVLGAELSWKAIRMAPERIRHRIFAPSSPRVHCSFPVVRMSLVLEHIQDPAKFLQKHIPIWDAREILVVVPNEFNPLQRVVGGSWFVSPWHHNYFTPVSLIDLFWRFGYRPVYRGATFPMELFILMGWDYRKNPDLGKQCHVLRLRMEKRLGPKVFQVYGLLHRTLGWGRELIYLFRKNPLGETTRRYDHRNLLRTP